MGAVARVLYGDVNPSGRLPATMPMQDGQLVLAEEQYPGIAFPDGLRTTYSEKLEVGYRWYLAHGVKPAYLFGFGLSYTTFSWSAADVLDTTGPYLVTVTVKN